MTTLPTARVALLTPAGRGAVASLLVEGPRATAVVSELFSPAGGKPLAEHRPGRIVFGRWLSRETGEEVVVCRRDDQRVEIHCHGGDAAAAAIVASLVARGCRSIDWRAWLRESNLDPIAAAAEAALAAATTERTAEILWDQRSGALRRALDEVAAQSSGGNSQCALGLVDGLLRWAELGKHLVEPWKVVLAGRPNVGKSSLINALVGFERAIVHGTPGTTRDVVTATTALDGWPVELADTAGLRDASEGVESAGIRLARDRVASADLVVLVLDASEPMTPEDESLAGDWPRALRVYNKCDRIAGRESATGPQGVLHTSATGGEGIEALGHEIAGRLVPAAPPVGQAMPFTAEQVDVLRQVRAALATGSLPAADRLLARLMGAAERGC